MEEFDWVRRCKICHKFIRRDEAVFIVKGGVAHIACVYKEGEENERGISRGDKRGTR
jgi:hypothetical protein